ncbi:MAG: 3'(2'),5'-bisphosphate nucleotidase CysQ [Halioglobus sp.]
MADESKTPVLQERVLPLLSLCRAAGEAICAHYLAPAAGDFEAKGDDSPLTRADLASHHLLHAGLLALDAAVPVLSEESAPADVAQRRQWRRYWLVDPLDGTREFLARTGEFTFNIALIDDHRPVLGVLYLPLERVAYVGIPGAVAHRYADAGAGNWSVSALATRRLESGRALVVLASRRHRGAQLQACLDWLAGHWEPVSRSNMGSALKFCRMASGEGDFYPRFSPCCEWDTAAGQAVLEAAGGCLLGLDGKPLRYNCRDSLYSPPFYAIADGGHPLWRQLLLAQLA